MNRMISLTFLPILVGASLFTNARGASDDALPAKGKAFALSVCAACHVVSSDQQSPPILRKPALRFDAIAKKPTTTAQWLRTFLTTTHVSVENSNGMPNPQLADYQIEEVISYILSLRVRQ